MILKIYLTNVLNNISGNITHYIIHSNFSYNNHSASQPARISIGLKKFLTRWTDKNMNHGFISIHEESYANHYFQGYYGQQPIISRDFYQIIFNYK